MQIAVEMVEDAFRRLKDAGQVGSAGMTRTREKLCAIPVGSEPIANAEGVQPGVYARMVSGTQIVCLPGTPRECAAVWAEIVPRIRELHADIPRAQRELEAPTADESALVVVVPGFQRSKEAGTRYIRGLPGEIEEDPETRNLVLTVENTTSGRLERHELDMVVLSVGSEPPPKAVALVPRLLPGNALSWRLCLSGATGREAEPPRQWVTRQSPVTSEFSWTCPHSRCSQ